MMTQRVYPVADQRSKLRFTVQRVSKNAAPKQKTGPKSPIQPVVPKTGCRNDVRAVAPASRRRLAKSIAARRILGFLRTKIRIVTKAEAVGLHG